MNSSARQHHEPSGLGITLTFAAGALLIATGLILAMYGLSALFAGVGRSTDVVVSISPTTWGLIHLVGGILLVLAGGNIFVGRYWARVTGVVVACIAILGGLASLEAYMFWAVGMIALNIAIIWALTQHGTDAAFD